MAAMRRRHQLWRWRLHNFRLLFVQGQMAPAAETVRCAELNQKATVAPYNLPGIDRGKSSGH